MGTLEVGGGDEGAAEDGGCGGSGERLALYRLAMRACGHRRDRIPRPL